MDLSLLPNYSKISQELKKAWDEVKTTGSLRVVLLEGVSGSYKTGIVEQFTNVAQAPLISGYNSEIPESYQPLRLAFESLLHLEIIQTELIKAQEDVSPEWKMALTTLARILPLLSLTSAPARDALARWQPHTPDRSIIDDDLETDETTHLTELPRLFTLALGEVAALFPLVFLLEYFNQADTATVDAFTMSILPALQNSRVLIIATFEPKEHRSPNELSHFIQTALDMPQTRQLKINPLTVEAIEQQLHYEFPNLKDERRKALAQQIHSGTSGILARIEDLVSWLKAQDPRALTHPLVVPQHQQWVKEQFTNLTEAAQTLVHIAAAQGMYFCMEAVLQTSGIASGVFQDLLKMPFGFVRLDSTVKVRDHELHWYHFYGRHIREIVYDGIPKETRLRLHSDLAYALEQLYKKDRKSIAGILAQQFERAGVAEKAAFYFALVAQQANDQGAADQAAGYAQQGLNMLADLNAAKLRGDLLLQKGRALANSEKTHLAEEPLRQALERGQQIHSSQLEMEASYYLGELLLNSSSFRDEGLECIERALDLAIEQEAWPVIVKGMEKLRTHYRTKDPQIFLDMCDQLTARIQQNPSSFAKITIAELLEDKAWLYLQKRQQKEALQTLEQAAVTTKGTRLFSHSPDIHYKLHLLRAQVFRGLQKYKQSLKEAELTLKWAKESLKRAQIAIAYQTKAITLRYMGKITAAEQEYKKALALLQNTSDQITLAEIEGNYGALLSNSGHKRRAREFYARSYKRRQKIDYRPGIHISLNNLAAIDKYLGLFQPALNIYQQLYSEGMAQDNKSRQSLSLNHIGDISRILNRLDEAEAAHRQAIQLCEIIDHPSRKTFALRYLGRTLLCSWRLNEAYTNLEEAERLIKDHKIATPNSILYNQIYIGRGALYAGNLSDASKRLEHTLKGLGKLQDQAGVGIGHLNLGLVWLVKGEAEKALDSAQGALEAFQNTESWRVPEAQHLLARCHLAVGNLDAAQLEIKQANRGFMNLGLAHRVFQVESTALRIQDALESGDWQAWRNLNPERELRYDFNHLGI